MPGQPRAVAVAATLLLLGAACRVDGGTASADAAPTDGAACVVRPPPSRYATWPMPDSTSADPARAPSYDLTTAGVVVDRVTGLAWQRAVDAGPYTWQQAAAACACLALGGRRDWRLPTRIELVSLVDVARSTPAIDGAAFPDTPPEWFWTSSPAADQPGAAWYVAFFDGDAHEMDVETPYRARCVRSDASPPPAHRFVAGDDGTVADTATGLTWQRAPDDAPRTWSDAAAACAALRLGSGAAAWRLPTAKELQTLIDESRADPAIDPDAFPETPADSFWAASPLAGQDGFAWFVSFHSGVAYNSPIESPHRVRCVR